MVVGRGGVISATRQFGALTDSGRYTKLKAIGAWYRYASCKYRTECWRSGDIYNNLKVLGRI